MLGNQVASDLELSTIYENVPIQTSWGKSVFQTKLSECCSDPKTIRRNQMPLMVLSQEPDVRDKIRSSVETLAPKIANIDQCFDHSDSRIKELITQILWKKESSGSFLNTSPFLLNLFITWKTIFLPGFAILMPLILLIVPFFFQKAMNPVLEVPEYLEHFKAVVLKQIAIPTFLRSRGANDRIGFFLESLFIAITLVMFISSLWNQINASLHLRTIWFDLDERGESIRLLRSTVGSIVDTLKGLPLKKQRAIRHILEKGEHALETTKHMVGLDNVATFGRLWNHPDELTELKDFLGLIDVLTSIASLPNICYPRISTNVGFNIQGVYHPSLKSCVPNSIQSDKKNHIILTGPNRGGKSTICKTVGLSIILAQSWGYAYAEKMSFSPFKRITTVLEPCGKLGVVSTFEAEIEFAKSVLANKDTPMFVMMDEIFHSTNALDGIAASKVFLRQLYRCKNVVSIISTHYIQLATDFQKEATPLQLVTLDNDDESLQYTYKIAQGVSSKSSVMEILKEKGLLEKKQE
jgi:hypothetical protein